MTHQKQYYPILVGFRPLKTHGRMAHRGPAGLAGKSEPPIGFVVGAVWRHPMERGLRAVAVDEAERLGISPEYAETVAQKRGFPHYHFEHD